jgi:hypothetical protein
MGACAEEIEVSAIRIRIAVSANDLRIMKGCLKPLNIILECRKAATMTFLSSDRRMVPRDMPRPTGVTVIGCVFLGAGVYLSSIAMIVLVAPKALSTLRALPFLYFNQTHEALCALGDWAHLDCRRVGALAGAELSPLHPHSFVSNRSSFGSAYICGSRPRLDMADARLRPRHYRESLDYFVPHETVYPERIPN